MSTWHTFTLIPAVKAKEVLTRVDIMDQQFIGVHVGDVKKAPTWRLFSRIRLTIVDSASVLGRVEVERLHVPINRVDVRRGLTFGDLAQNYAEHELKKCPESIRPKAHTTIKGYERVLRNRLLPRWGEQNRTWHRTVGSGAVAEGLEKGRRACQSDARQDSSRDVLGV